MIATLPKTTVITQHRDSITDSTQHRDSITDPGTDSGASNEVRPREWFYNIGRYAIAKDGAPTDEERAWSDYSRCNLHRWADENPF